LEGNQLIFKLAIALKSGE